MLHQQTILLSPLATYDVVIPCHDRAHVVADAVASVLEQDHAPGRVIVVDDLPRSLIGKVLRREVRERLMS